MRDPEHPVRQSLRVRVTLEAGRSKPVHQRRRVDPQLDASRPRGLDAEDGLQPLAERFARRVTVGDREGDAVFAVQVAVPDIEAEEPQQVLGALGGRDEGVPRVHAPRKRLECVGPAVVGHLADDGELVPGTMEATDVHASCRVRPVLRATRNGWFAVALTSRWLRRTTL